MQVNKRPIFDPFATKPIKRVGNYSDAI